MNELIRKLLDEAITDVDVVTGDETLDDELYKMYIPDCFAKKFAELIIEECIRCCDDIDAIQKHYLKYHIDQELGASQCIEVIKQHFGIKE